MSRSGTSGSCISFSSDMFLFVSTASNNRTFPRFRLPVACNLLPSLPRFAVESDRLAAILDDLARDHAFTDRILRRDRVHDVEHQLFDDDLQSASADVALECGIGDRLERVVGELQRNVLEAHDRLVLTDERVLRLAENLDESS